MIEYFSLIFLIIYLSLFVFFIFCSIYTFVRVRKLHLFVKDFEEEWGSWRIERREYYYKAKEHLDSRIDSLNDNIKELTGNIDELRLQVGILKGSIGSTIHLNSAHEGNNRLVYKGAKRGPKPKNQGNE